MKRMALIGFAIWAAATLALRLAGQFVFAHELALLAVTIPLMIALAFVLLRNAADRARAAIALIAPGMLLDTISALRFGDVFPNIPASAAGTFGGWLLLCNVLVLLTAIATSAPAARRAA
jgi:hypothetical protein